MVTDQRLTLEELSDHGATDAATGVRVEGVMPSNVSNTSDLPTTAASGVKSQFSSIVHLRIAFKVTYKEINETILSGKIILILTC